MNTESLSVKVLAITQARTGSSRLPAKVLRSISGKTLLQTHIERLGRARTLDKVVIATTTKGADSAIARLAEGWGVTCVRGSEHDVLDRYHQAARRFQPQYVVRVTSDCPLVDPQVVDAVVEALIANEVDYATNCLERTFPHGMDVEAFRFDALVRAWREAKQPQEREHVTPYIRENSDYRGGTMFRAFSVTADADYSQYRMTVDYPEDFELVSSLVNSLGTDMGWRDYADFLATNSNVNEINSQFRIKG